jgi:chromosome segregation ATPase
MTSNLETEKKTIDEKLMECQKELHTKQIMVVDLESSVEEKKKSIEHYQTNMSALRAERDQLFEQVSKLEKSNVFFPCNIHYLLFKIFLF